MHAQCLHKALIKPPSGRSIVWNLARETGQLHSQPNCLAPVRVLLLMSEGLHFQASRPHTGILSSLPGLGPAARNQLPEPRESVSVLEYLDIPDSAFSAAEILKCTLF